MKWEIWAPFQSEQLADIKSHLTPKEMWSYRLQSILCGAWAGATFAAPLASGLAWPVKLHSLPALLINGTLVVIGIIGLMLMQKKYTAFLCSTERAKQMGYTAENLKFYRFP